MSSFHSSGHDVATRNKKTNNDRATSSSLACGQHNGRSHLYKDISCAAADFSRAPSRNAPFPALKTRVFSSPHVKKPKALVFPTFLFLSRREFVQQTAMRTRRTILWAGFQPGR